MTKTALVGVTLLALASNVASFCVPPPATSTRSARTYTLNRAQVLPRSANTISWHANPQDFAELRGGGLVLSASEGSTVVDGASPRPPVDFAAIAKYIAGTGAEFGMIMGGLFLLQSYVLPRLGAKVAKATVFFTFGFLAMKSRTFGVLNARRPKVLTEKDAKNERRRPDWMPPPKVFPFIWITIGVLRAVSSTLVWEALGNKLVAAPIAAMILHLSVGDTWNHINNVEKRLGVAVPVVFLVWLSVANTAFRYYRVLPKAGLVVLPSVIWIAVANLLVQSIWRLNGKEPLYPAKKASQ